MNDHWNHVTLCGKAQGEPVLSHVNHNVPFYKFILAVPRLSGQVDALPVIASGAQLATAPFSPGDVLTVQGQLRSFNNRSGEGPRLVLSVFAFTLEKAGRESVNVIQISGILCKPPIVRHTPLGREICDAILAVNRRYGRSDYLPCIAWGALAQAVGRLRVGEHLTAEGRVQSRLYNKATLGGVQERTAYEVSIMRPATVEEFMGKGALDGGGEAGV